MIPKGKNIVAHHGAVPKIELLGRDSTILNILLGEGKLITSGLQHSPLVGESILSLQKVKPWRRDNILDWNKTALGISHFLVPCTENSGRDTFSSLWRTTCSYLMSEFT